MISVVNVISETDSLPGNSSLKQATQKPKKQADFRIEGKAIPLNNIWWELMCNEELA